MEIPFQADLRASVPERRQEARIVEKQSQDKTRAFVRILLVWAVCNGANPGLHVSWGAGFVVLFHRCYGTPFAAQVRRPGAAGIFNNRVHTYNFFFFFCSAAVNRDQGH